MEGSHIAHKLTNAPSRIMDADQRGTSLSADYVLSMHCPQLAVVESKRAGLGHTDGVGQAKDYTRLLQARMTYSTYGAGWHGIDVNTGAEGNLTAPFPTPEGLWDRCFPTGNDWRDRFGAVPFETGGGK